MWRSGPTLGGIIIILIHQQTKIKEDLMPAYSIALPKWLNYTLILFLILGIGLKIFYFFLN